MNDPQAHPLLHPRFGRRRVTPHVSVIESISHVRTFLADAFAELDFVTHECSDAEAALAVDDKIPCDLVVLGLPLASPGAPATLRTLAAAGFGGKVLLVGVRNSIALKATQQFAEQLGLTMLPTLGTPFRIAELAERVAALRPSGPSPQAPVDVEEALRNDWLELWYQPKIDPRSLLTRGAEALLRLRHPIWGTVLPAYFISADGDPHLSETSEFVMARAMEDWLYFAEDRTPVEIAINLPMTALREPEFVERLRRHLPRHPAFGGFIIEINGANIVHDLPLAQEISARLRFHNIGISIDDVGAEWSLLARLENFPFVEIKMDRTFVHGCAADRLKFSMCGTIIDVARRFGIRTVAKGVETRDDFLAVRELGFDLVQGFLFAKPMDRRKFARSLLNRHVEVLG